MRPLALKDRCSLADRAGTTYLHMRNIAFSGKPCGPLLAAGTEAATGGAVMRWDLRPTDWHRIWPELIGADGAPDVPEPVTQPGALDEVRDAA